MLPGHLGEFEQLLLFALVRQGGEAHGAAITDELERRTGRAVSPGATYTVLERMERKGLVKSWIGDSTPERGGRRRRCYRIQPAGARALRDTYRALRSVADGTGGVLDRLAAKS